MVWRGCFEIMDHQFERIVNILVNAFWPMLKAGLQFSIPLTLITFTLGIILAFGIALARLYGGTFIASLARFYVWVFRGTPLMVQLFIIFYGLPSVGLVIGGFTSAVIGFTLNVGAYASETIRGSILGVPKGQWDAAHVLKLSKWQTMVHVILPQALRTAVPPLSNTFISLVKDTSLAAAITVTELFQVTQQITARTYEPLWLYMEAALIYLALSTVLTYLQQQLEVRLNRPFAG